MKRIIILLALFAAPVSRASAQKADSVSLYILKRMEASIGNLKSFSMQVTTTYDMNTEGLGLVKYSENAHVRVLRPDRMAVERHGDNGRQFIVYDGKQAQVYNRGGNTYARLKFTGTVAEMIDSLSRGYGIDFPAADILYPDFVNDAVVTSTQIAYLGITQIDGKDCFHIAAATPERNWQIWIGDDALNLPMRLVIVYKQNDGCPQYQADYRDWKLNETESDAVFDFIPVPGAQEVPLKPSSTNE